LIDTNALPLRQTACCQRWAGGAHNQSNMNMY